MNNIDRYKIVNSDKLTDSSGYALVIDTVTGRVTRVKIGESA